MESGSALGAAERASARASERVRSLPVRSWCRRQGFPLPPGRLDRTRVAGTEDVGWLPTRGPRRSGASARSARQGLALESFRDVLDFGCGVGRVLRHWKDLSGPVVHGADAHPDSVAWCQANLRFARFQVNGLDRGLKAAASSFDFIYALLVFTHLVEPLQRFWMDELTPRAAAGGVSPAHDARGLLPGPAHAGGAVAIRPRSDDRSRVGRCWHQRLRRVSPGALCPLNAGEGTRGRGVPGPWTRATPGKMRISYENRPWPRAA